MTCTGCDGAGGGTYLVEESFGRQTRALWLCEVCWGSGDELRPCKVRPK